MSPHKGLMTAEELRQLEAVPSPHSKFWVPCMWFVSLALRSRSEGRINNDVALSAILNVGSRVCFRTTEQDCMRTCVTPWLLCTACVLCDSGAEHPPYTVHEAVQL